MDKLKDIIILMVPRILGGINRDDKTSTYGCGDRYFWNYKLHDLSNARFQEACLLLALLHECNFDGNIYFRNNKILKWSIGIIEFWLSTLHKGYFSEVYPFERSTCATSFSTFAVSEALIILGSNSGQETVADFMKKTYFTDKLFDIGIWLGKNFNRKVANQMAAAMLSLYNIYIFTKEDIFREKAKELFAVLQENYRLNGYFPEYGGLDIGYLSITNSCLAWYADKIGNEQSVLGMIDGVNRLLEQRIDDTGNYDFTSTSRNTQFLYTYGFYKTKSPVLEKILNGISLYKIITPLWMDDRYCIAMTIDYMKTYTEYMKDKAYVAKGT
ncbi:MAG: hypothetical protein HQL06_09010 [Nitrospirae bacterium]|nr:hypothetical protein [Nitrospirota bacterium]